MAASFGQMNQEISIDMIYAILYSITQYTIGKPKVANLSALDKNQKLDDFKEVYHGYDFKNQNVTKIDFMMLMPEGDGTEEET